MIPAVAGVKAGWARAAYAAAGPLAFLLSPLLPLSSHPGRRARRTLADLPGLGFPIDARFARAVLRSRWRSALLLEFLCRVPDAQLHAFLDSHVHVEGEIPLAAPSGARRPVILVTPHYGACVVGCLCAARRLRDQRRLSVYYEQNSRNSGISELFHRVGVRSAAQLSGLSGAAHALEALEQGGCLAMMPDVYLDVADTVAVPFFGRWLRAAGGAAFLALRSGAWLVPAYAVPDSRMGITLRCSPAIDPASAASGDGAQKLFSLTCRLFADIERVLRRAPEHWLQWERLPLISTPLDLPRSADISDLLRALEKRCRAFPALLRHIPELAAALSGLERAPS